jgi:hypothetical protein
MEYLNECEKIIENLKRLTNQESRKVSMKINLERGSLGNARQGDPSKYSRKNWSKYSRELNGNNHHEVYESYNSHRTKEPVFFG